MIQVFKLLERLDSCQVRYMVIGGMAAVFHGSSTATLDLDISISMQPGELLKLRECLKDLHPVHRMTPQKLSFLNHPGSLEGLSNLYLQTDLGVLDVIGDLSLAGDFKDLFARAEIYEISGRQIRVISLPDLITLKKRLGREKDLISAKELELILKRRS